MDVSNSEYEWSLENIRRALLDGRNARDAGGEDARANLPAPDGHYVPRFKRDVATRAGAMGHAIREWAFDEFAKSAAPLRDNPFSVDAAAEKGRHVPTVVKAEINQLIAEETTRLLDVGTQAREADTAYRRARQMADTSDPPRGWISLLELLIVGWFVLCLEGGLSTWLLWHALGPSRAVWTGFILSGGSLVLGAFAAGALLHPVKREQMSAAREILQRLLAVTFAMAALFFMYVGACYRAAWIDGEDGTPAEIFMIFGSPWHVLINIDVLALLIMGIVGFFVGALECWRFYNGYHALLRESGLAKARADSAAREAAAELRAMVQSIGTDGGANLDEIEQSSAAWVHCVVRQDEAANGVGHEADGRDDKVCHSVDSLTAEYDDGFYEVRPFARVTVPGFAIGRDPVVVPELFAKARQAAIAGAFEVSGVVREARAQIAADVKAAMTQIDELAGLRPASPNQPLLPTKE